MIGVVVYFVGMGIYTVSYIFGMIGSTTIFSTQSRNARMGLTMLLVMVIPILAVLVMNLVLGALNIYALVGTVRTARGKPFRYVIVGNWLERMMQKKSDKNIPARQV